MQPGDNQLPLDTQITEPAGHDNPVLPENSSTSPPPEIKQVPNSPPLTQPSWWGLIGFRGTTTSAAPAPPENSLTLGIEQSKDAETQLPNNDSQAETVASPPPSTGSPPLNDTLSAPSGLVLSSSQQGQALATDESATQPTGHDPPKDTDCQTRSSDEAVQNGDGKTTSEGEEAVPGTGSRQPQSGSGWYNPVGWYSWYNPTPQTVSTTMVPPGTGEVDEEKSGGEDVISEAKDVTDDTNLLGRTEQMDDTPIVHPIVAPIPSPARMELPNPIAATLTMNKLGWAAFFAQSSRTFMVRRITENGEPGSTTSRGIEGVPSAGSSNDEMEVMEVDLGDAGSESEDLVIQSSNKEGSVAAPPRKLASKNNAKEKLHPPPPLTGSESIKRKVANSSVPTKTPRADSPTPSLTPSTIKQTASKGATGKPTTPRSATPSSAQRTGVPNLVLPTFADTFHALPRSRPVKRIEEPVTTEVPPLQRTIGYVSSVLFSRPDMEHAGSREIGSSSTKSGFAKGKQKQVMSHADIMEEQMQEFGKELPRALGSVETNYVNESIGQYRRVVIIGVHGWFPGATIRTVLGEVSYSHFMFHLRKSDCCGFTCRLPKSLPGRARSWPI